MPHLAPGPGPAPAGPHEPDQCRAGHRLAGPAVRVLMAADRGRAIRRFLDYHRRRPRLCCPHGEARAHRQPAWISAAAAQKTLEVKRHTW